MKKYGPQYKATYPAGTYQADFMKQVKDSSLLDLTIRALFETAAYGDGELPTSMIVNAMLLNAPKERLQKIGTAYYLEIARRVAVKHNGAPDTGKFFLPKHFAMVCRRDGIRTQEAVTLLTRVLAEIAQQR